MYSGCSTDGFCVGASLSQVNAHIYPRGNYKPIEGPSFDVSFMPVCELKERDFSP
jgi:hypothetical protein